MVFGKVMTINYYNEGTLCLVMMVVMMMMMVVEHPHFFV